MDKDKNKDSGYPKSAEPMFTSPINKTETIWIGNTSWNKTKGYKELTPEDHMELKGYQPLINSQPSFLKPAYEHFTRDVNEPGQESYPVKYTDSDGNQIPVYSGATTHRNPLDDPAVETMQKYGLDTYDIETVRKQLGNDKLSRLRSQLTNH